VTVYRFFQEALLNVVKHADVDEAEATLAIRRDVLIATVHDAGPGFDPDKVESIGGRHLGIACCGSEPGWLAAPWTFETGIAHGTTLTLRLPARPRVPAAGPVLNGNAAPADPAVSDRPADSEAR